MLNQENLNFNLNFNDNMSQGQRRFNNNKLQHLFERIHSYEASQMNTANDIYNSFDELIQGILNDPIALQEAREWNEFTPILEHENGKHYFDLMSRGVSRAFSLWMWIWH